MGEGPARLPPQRPLQGRRSGLLVQALGRTWDGRAGVKAEAPSKGTRRSKCSSRCLTPDPGQSPRLRVPRERGRVAKVYGG